MTSGIRVGTPAITRRGFKEAEAKELAGWMCDVLDSINDEAVIERIKGKVLDICAPLPGLRISETVNLLKKGFLREAFLRYCAIKSVVTAPQHTK
ncbi:serine hydroxymethyltransferase [Streptococcus pneumoniae]|nr:serine hydroxymethyltransferase [Streptococcus pneumoniae]